MLQIKRTTIGVICLQIATATNGHYYIVFKYYVMYITWTYDRNKTHIVDSFIYVIKIKVYF